MTMLFRKLRADEIECRVQQIKRNGLSLLLYKDARCDMNILDETVGPMNWQRSHLRDNSNCMVSIWDSEKNSWIVKEDTGTESNTEKEKGLASDSFKRACFNWGIGRELYTAPFIWVKPDNYEAQEKNGKYKTFDKFVVSKITYDDAGRINSLVIKNQRTGRPAFSMGNTVKKDNSKSDVNYFNLVKDAFKSGKVKKEQIDEYLAYFEVDKFNKLTKERQLAFCLKEGLVNENE